MQFIRLALRIATELNFVLTASVVVAVASLAASKAHAQQTLPEVRVSDKAAVPNERIPLDQPIEAGSRLGITARETAASVSIIDRQSMEARESRDSKEALRAAPGVHGSAPPGFAGYVTMRGFSGGQITQMWNGINTLYDVISARPVDAWLLERIEVIGGPSSFLHGAGAVGGGINYVTKIAQREPGTHDVYAAIGSFDATRLAYGFNGALGGANATNWVRLDVSRQDSNGYVNRSDSKSTAIAASWLTDITKSLSHTLAYDYVDEDRLPYWGTPVRNPVNAMTADPATIRTNYNVSDGLYTNQVHWGRSILEYRLSADTTFKNTAYAHDAERLYRNVEVYRWNAANTLIERGSLLATRHGQRLVGDRLEITHKSTLFGLKSDWAGGFDLQANKQTRFPFSFRNITATTGAALDTVSPSAVTPGTFFGFGGIQDADNPDRDTRNVTRGLFVENRTRLTERLSLLTGLRGDRVSWSVRNYRAVAATDPLFASRNFRASTGRIGLMYEFSPHANVYATYSTAADPPAGSLATASFAQLRTFDLTTGRQFEIGTKFDFAENRGNATLAAYRIVRKNLAITDPANSLNVLAVGQQSSAGVEAAVGWRLSPQWRVQANTAFVNPRYDQFFEAVGATSVSRAGNDPTNTPRWLANAWLTWNPVANWESGLSYRHVGRVYADNANMLSVPGYDVWDWYVSYKVRKDTTLALRIRNLADKDYVMNVTGSPLLIYGEPRSIDLSVRASF